MAPIRISRTGLTRCPGCKAHIKVATELRQTVCPFCESSLVRPKGHVQGLVARSRGALVAASLLASPGLAACLGSGTSGGGGDVYPDAAQDVAADTTPDISQAPAYGEPMDIVVPSNDTADDTAMDVEVVEEVGAGLLYGMPPDASAPEYGMPPVDAE
jgi:hypothetical protein